MMQSSEVQTFRARYAFVPGEPDELELHAGDLIDVSVRNAGDWGVGVCRRTQKEGCFPWSYVEPFVAQPQNPHRLELVTLSRPAYCQHCEDFIWGGSKQGYRCSACAFTCHKTCKFFVENNSGLECVPSSQPRPPEPESINSWTLEDVRMWLYAAKLQEFEHAFVGRGIDGLALRTLNNAALQEMGIKEEDHKTMVMACLSELLHGDSTMIDVDFAGRCKATRPEQLDVLKQMDLLPHESPSEKQVHITRNHRFKLKTFIHPTYCDTCRKYLFGLLRQGLQCVECGFNSHRMCIDTVPLCQPDMFAVKKLDKLPPGTATCLLGEPLETQLGKKDKAPKLVLNCIKSVEKHLSTPNLYRDAPSADEIRMLRAMVLTKGEVSLDKQPTLAVTGFLKLYFYELPIPLIPFEFYDRIISAVQNGAEPAQNAATLDSLISEFPPAHITVLEVLLAHLGKVVSKCDKNGMDPNTLATVWGSIILRPPDDQLFKAVLNSAAQTAAVQLMITRCSFGGVPKLPKKMASVTSDAPPLLPRKTQRLSVSANSQSVYENLSLKRPAAPAPAPPPRPANAQPPRGKSTKQDLTRFPWFAGAMERATAENKLHDRVDGSFLVRVSQSRPGYSLTVKFREIRHVVIVESNGKFGFSEPTIFNSLPDLISHFSKSSLSVYNAELETTLAYPFTEAPMESAATDTGYEDALDEDLYISNVEALREKLDRAGRQNPAQRIAPYFSTRVKQLQRDLRAQEEILTMLREQKKLHESYHSSLGDSERAAVMKNFELLLARLTGAEKKYESLSQAARAEQEKEENALGRDGRRHKGYPGQLNPIPDPATSAFYVGLVPREEAMRMLSGRRDGTYLVRKSDRDKDPYTLSLRYNDDTKHIQIKDDGERFGLAEPLAFYSLEALCDYYKTEMLSNTIKTSLRTPVRSSQTDA